MSNIFLDICIGIGFQILVLARTPRWIIMSNIFLDFGIGIGFNMLILVRT